MKNKIAISLIVFLSGMFSISAQNIIFKNAVDSYILDVKKKYEIPGLSLCIVKNNVVIYRNSIGMANIEHNVPIRDSSIFRVYSLTKPIIAVGVFQLIEQGKLQLDDPISKYIDDIPDAWKSIQIRYLLAHSSGLPDMKSFGGGKQPIEEKAKELAFREKIKFNTGEIYEYNQTNFWLLKLIIEKVSGENLTNFICKNQFSGEQNSVFFSSDSKQIIKNRVTSYFPFSTGKMIIDLPTIVGDYMHAANGLNITIEEFLKWDRKLKNNELLKEETKREMWKTFPFSKSNKVFTYAWDKFTLNGHDSYGFTGSLITAYRVFPKDNLSIVLLSNGLGKIYDIDDVVDKIATLVDSDIYNVQEKAVEDMYSIFKDKGFLVFKNAYDSQKERVNQEINLERLVNSVGYKLLRNNFIDDAIKVFQFNTSEYKNSANAHDSLGEAYYTQGNFEKAKLYYKKAISLGGTNGNAKEMLDKILKR